MSFTDLETEYLRHQDIGRLATVQPDGTIQVNPVMFRYNAELGTLDVGGHNMASTQKFHNVTHDERVAFVIDDIVSRDPWRVRCVEIRGTAETARTAGGPWTGTDGAIIRIHPQRIISFGLDQPDLDPHLITANTRNMT